MPTNVQVGSLPITSLSSGGGTIAVNPDGSIAVTPAAAQVISMAGTTKMQADIEDPDTFIQKAVLGFNFMVGAEGVETSILTAGPSGIGITGTITSGSAVLTLPGTTGTIALLSDVTGAITGLWQQKGSTDCSGNPNYPVASKGWTYIVTVAGKIGGASGTAVDVGDIYYALADNAGGTQASVGTSWGHLEHNIPALGTLATQNANAVSISGGTLTGVSVNGVTLAGSGTLSTTGGTLGTLAFQSGTFSGTSSGTNTGDQTITLTGNVTGSGTGSFATTIAAAAVTNAMLAGSIAYSKLTLTGAVLNADLAGSIAYSKLSLTGAILNTDLAGSIASSKLIGTDITSLANLVTVGTITSGTWSGSFGTVSGSNLTSLTAANITGSHTLPDGVLSTNVPLLNAVNAFTARQSITAGTLADGTKAVSITATMPTSISAESKCFDMQITSAGSSTQQNEAFNVEYLAGYTGSSGTRCLRFINNVAGTMTAFADGNLGAAGGSRATTAGTNIGVSGDANGGSKSIGAILYATTAKNSATNIGTLGLALNTGTSPIQVGGFFGLMAAYPTFASAALMCDNGTQANDIFVARDNGTVVFTIADGGAVTATQALTVTGVITPTGGIVGTTAAGNATAGNLGEFVSSLVASGSAVGLTTATTANVTSVSLTAGDWDVTGSVNYSGTVATVTAKTSGISSTSATMPTDGSEVQSGVQMTLLSAVDGSTIARKRINVSSTTTVYLVANCTFSAGAVSAYGNITARRIR